MRVDLDLEQVTTFVDLHHILKVFLSDFAHPKAETAVVAQGVVGVDTQIAGDQESSS